MASVSRAEDADVKAVLFSEETLAKRVVSSDEGVDRQRGKGKG